MKNDWDSAFHEHAIVVQAYVAGVQAVPRALWGTPRAPGKWSPAEEALHIVKAYELAGAADGSAEGMRLVTSPLVAWMARTFYLPVMLRRRTFPRNARHRGRCDPTRRVRASCRGKRRRYASRT